MSFLQPGETAHDIALPDPEGRPVRPLAGGNEAAGDLLLVFYKDTCPTCRYAMPFVQRVHAELAARGGRVVAIAQDDAERTKVFATELGLTLPMLIDAPDYAASKAYGLQSVPSFFLIDTASRIRLSFAGFSRRLLADAAAQLAASIGAPSPAIFQSHEQILESKPG